MQITDVETLEYLMSAAMASYGDFTDGDFREKLKEKGFTETQADEFIERYDFIHQEVQLITGFSATVFWDKIDQKHVLAIRGTESGLLSAGPDWTSNLIGIGVHGFAVDQAVALYRYWRQLITPAGQEVQYSTDELLQLYKLLTDRDGHDGEFAGQKLLKPEFILWRQIISGDVGLGEGVQNSVSA